MNAKRLFKKNENYDDKYELTVDPRFTHYNYQEKQNMKQEL